MTGEGSAGIALVSNGKELVPHAMRRPVIAHTKSQPVRTRRLRPGSYDVTFRAHIDAVPGLILRVPTIEIVMMIGDRHKVFGASGIPLPINSGGRHVLRSVSLPPQSRLPQSGI